MGLSSDVPRLDHSVNQVGNGGGGHSEAIPQLSQGQRRISLLRHHDMKQCVEIVVADVMECREQARDPVGLGGEGA